MRFLVIFLLAICAVTSFVIPIQLGSTTVVKEQAETLEMRDTYWYTNVTIGTPPQVFAMLVDTKSNTIWVSDDLCDSTCYGKRRYNKDRSSSFKPWVFDTEFNMTDHLGLTSIMMGTETITLGRNPAGNVQYSGFFGQAVHLENALVAVDGIDGVIGIGLAGLAFEALKGPMNEAYSNGNMNQSVYTLWLEDQGQSKDNGTHGVIYYGNYDPLHCAPTMTEALLTSGSYIQFTVSSFVVNGGAYNTKTQAIIDSTSLFIAVPPKVVTLILQQLNLPANTALPAQVPCNSHIYLSFNHGSNSQNVTDLNLLTPLANGSCELAIQKSYDMNGDGGNRFELGIPFLRGRCTYVDFRLHKLGFANAATHGSEN